MIKPTDKQIEARKKYSKSNGLPFGKNERYFGKSTEENRAARIKAVNKVKADDYASNVFSDIYYQQLKDGNISHPGAIGQLNQLLEHGKILRH